MRTRVREYAQVRARLKTETSPEDTSRVLRCASGIKLSLACMIGPGRCHSLCKCPSVYEETPPVTSTPLVAVMTR
jgi:hypothetical protein